MRRPALAILALSLLALLFGWETRQALRETPARQDIAAATGTWQPGVSAPDPQPPPDPAPTAAAVAARPLFRPDRQAFHEQGASVRNFEAELARYALLGVLGFGDAPYGVVVGKAGSKGERWEIRKGDSFQGFTVKEVGMEGLWLTVEEREFLLPLYAGAPTAAAGAVRTETQRAAAGQPAAPVSAAPARVGGPVRPGVPPRPGAPAAYSPPANPPESTAPASPRPGFPPLPPGLGQRYLPGRR
jgi:hypothetical protein